MQANPSDGPQRAPAQASLTVRAFALADSIAWDRFVRNSEQGTFFHLVGWRRIFEDVFKLHPHYLVAERNAASHAAAAASPKAIAVLPFLDLTDSMNEEPFADGMTEELIHRLSKVKGLRVPAPTASFYFKGKQLPVAEIARSLHVSYVLDGSVRKSGETLRVAARLVRADDGYVVWSENYDRPLTDKLMVQDDIASEVTSALSRTSID